MPTWTMTAGWTSSSTNNSCEPDPHTGSWDDDFAGATSTLSQTTATVAGEPFMTLEEIFYGGADAAPVPVTGGDNWTILIEGEPTSIKAQIDMKASIVNDQRFAPGDLTLPAYYATSVPMLQAVPLVVDAAPGILWPNVFSSFKPDLRELAATGR